jgi:hypothetical protein
MSSTLADGFVAAGVTVLRALDHGVDKAPSDFDQPQRFVTYFIWNMPPGRKCQKMGRQVPTAGWETSGLLTFQTGSHSPSWIILDLGAIEGVGRPRLTGPCPSD